MDLKSVSTTPNDTHKLWVMCLGVAQAWEALAGAGCAHCDVFTWCLPLSSTGPTTSAPAYLMLAEGLGWRVWDGSFPSSILGRQFGCPCVESGRPVFGFFQFSRRTVRWPIWLRGARCYGGRGGHYIWACLLFVTSVWRAAGHNARLLDWNWTGWWRNRSPLQADWMSASWWVIRICLLRDFRSSLSCMTSSASHGGTHFCLRLLP